MVTPYADRKLYLINVRETTSLQEADYVEIQAFAKYLGVESPAIYPFSDIEGLMELAKGMSKFDEGFVCVGENLFDGRNHGRIKVKNPAYLAIAHLKDSVGASMRGMMMLVMSGEYSEFVQYFPEFKKYIDTLAETYKKYLADCNAGLELVRSMLGQERTPENRKAFAMIAKNTRSPSTLFLIYDGYADSVIGVINYMISNHGLKKVAKDMLTICKIKDIDFTVKE